MKIAVICKSDSTGGAAVVSRRLTEALRLKGADASLLVEQKLTDLPFVVKTDMPIREKTAFLRERLQIFRANGFSRKNLFKVDTASFGIPLWRHPLVLEADAVILNWVNQGMLSLDGVKKIHRLGKKIIWTMHDMWNLTGICHHAIDCCNFLKECGNCFLLDKMAATNDLSHKTWLKKNSLYAETDITFVAVSRWLADKARESSLLANSNIVHIPNPLKTLEPQNPETLKPPNPKILFAAATLDNWIKGLSTFRESIRILKDRHPELVDAARITLMGAVKNPSCLEGFPLPVDYLGEVKGEENLAKVFADSAVTVNCSHFENLPGTLIEAQAYGSIPVAFDRGGQRDIIDHLQTGVLVAWADDEKERGAKMAEGVAWAIQQQKNGAEEIRQRMRQSVENRFSYEAVADKYLEILGQ